MAVPENRNILWASVIVEELARCGVRWVVIAPGSRSTPLVVAFARHPQIETISVIDERSAAFVALGIALATRVPAAVVCSSGTAAANFYPAVVEARQAGVPLLVMTADRPHELRESGANQTIDQVRMYGSHALWAVDVSLPEQDPLPITVRSLRTLAARAYSTSIGWPAGAVHLNFPFRKPLEPTFVPGDVTNLVEAVRMGNQPFTNMTLGEIALAPRQLDALSQMVRTARRAVVFCGPFTPEGGVQSALRDFSANTGIPILADPLSNLRWSELKTIGAYDSFGSLSAALGEIDLWIQLGGQSASKSVEDYLNSGLAARVVQLSPDGVWRDPYHQLAEFVHGSPALLLESVVASLRDVPITLDREWADRLWAREAAVWAHYKEGLDWFDGGVVAEVVRSVPEGSNVVVASSLPVRNLEQYSPPAQRDLHVFCNRGASGIDGTVSTAFGVALASRRPTCLVIGDLALLHDIGGLLCASRLGVPVVIVVVNNDGGGIFRRLPIQDFEPAFTNLFLTPHGRTFRGAAEMYGLEYQWVAAYNELSASVDAAFGSGRSWLIEAVTDSVQDVRVRSNLQKSLVPVLHRVSLDG